MNTEHFKTLLTEELQSLNESLSSIGEQNSDGTWEGSSSEMDTDKAEKADIADNIEEKMTNDAVVREMNVRLHDIQGALDRIENGTYGVCEQCGKEIAPERLAVNPSALTCVHC
jgi:RNA polymerase-binding transcription factor DksA